MRLPSYVGGKTTHEVGFFDIDADRLSAWLLRGLGEGWGLSTAAWRSMTDVVEALRPVTVLSREACIPIGSWSLQLNNTPSGTDVGVVPSRAARELGCRAMRAVCTEDGEVVYPARILNVYGPAGRPPLAIERNIVAANDGGRWVFETSGTPFPFEDTAAYSNRLKSTRFTSAGSRDQRNNSVRRRP